MDGVGGKRGWQWWVLRRLSFLSPRNSVRIFILEGLLTIAMSAVAIFLVPTWPQKVKWVRVTASREL